MQSDNLIHAYVCVMFCKNVSQYETLLIFVYFSLYQINIEAWRNVFYIFTWSSIGNGSMAKPTEQPKASTGAGCGVPSQWWCHVTLIDCSFLSVIGQYFIHIYDDVRL